MIICAIILVLLHLEEILKKNSLVKEDSYDLWHQHFGHLPKNALWQNPTWVTGVPNIVFSESIPPCKGCALGKMHDHSYPPSGKHASHPGPSPLSLALVHTTFSLLLMTFQVAPLLCFFITKMPLHSISGPWAETFPGHMLTSVHSDLGGNLWLENLECSSRPKESLIRCPFLIHPNKTAMQRGSTKLCLKKQKPYTNACLPKSFWQDAVETALHIYNWQPMHHHDWKMPIESFKEDEPDISYFKVSKILEWPKPPKVQLLPGWTTSEEEEEEQPSAGPSTCTWMPPKQSPEESLAQFHIWPHQYCPIRDKRSLLRPPTEVHWSTRIPISWVLPDNTYGDRPPIEIKQDLQQGLDPIQEEHMVVEPPIEPPHSTNEDDDISDMYSFKWIHHHMTLAIDSSPTPLPKHYKNILKLSREDQELWTASIKEEIKFLYRRKVWELVDLPKGHKPIKGRWVFALKSDRQRKSWFIIKEFTQVFKIDHKNTFSPIARFKTLHLLLSLAALHDWEIKALDVKATFLFGELDEKVYMKQSEGFVVKGQEKRVCRLRKAIYGLKQAVLQWNKQLHKSLLEMGFVRCKSDPGTYFKIIKEEIIILLVYVGDALLWVAMRHESSHTKRISWSNGNLAIFVLQRNT